MAFIELPTDLVAALGPEMQPGLHWIDVWLKDGRTFKTLVVRSGRVITGLAKHPDGEGPLDFIADDIVAIRRVRLLPFGRWTFRTDVLAP